MTRSWTCVSVPLNGSTAGKLAGILTMNETLIDRSAEAGADRIGIGVDTLLLGSALRAPQRNQ